MFTSVTYRKNNEKTTYSTIWFASTDTATLGCLTALSNLSTKGKVASGNFIYNADFDVTGYTLQGQLGVAFNL